MTIEEKSRIKAHLDELCEWVDEQPTEETGFWKEAFDSLVEGIDDTIRNLERDNDSLATDCDKLHEEVRLLESAVAEATEQTEEAYKKLDEMSAKVNLLKNYLDTYIDFLCAAMDYEEEAGNVRAQEEHRIEIGPAVCAKVALVQLFKDDDTAKVIDSIELYEKLSDSYRRLAANL